MKLTIRVIPNAMQRKVFKNDDGTLKVWVRSKPFRGEASDEVILALSDYYKIPKTSISIVKGATSRNKIVEILD